MKAALLVLAFSSATLLAQTPLPSFEVASVKPNTLRQGIRGHSFPGDRFEATNVPLRDLIIIAYGKPGQFLPASQLSGGPDWMNSDRFDVSARTDGRSPNSVSQKQLMLRTLLQDRFKLAVRLETREQAIYVLTTARADRTLGRELRRAPVACEGVLAAGQPGIRDTCIMSGPFNGQFIFRGQSLESLASGLSLLLNRVVLDKTALDGAFDGDITFDPRSLPGMPPLGSSDQAPSDKPALDTALRDQLGLKLESARGTVEVLVIDHVERPTEN